MKVGRSNARTMAAARGTLAEVPALCRFAESQQAIRRPLGRAGEADSGQIMAAPTAEAARDRVLFKFSPKIVPFAVTGKGQREMLQER